MVILYLVAALLVVVALGVAVVAERRRPRGAPAHRSYDYPRQLHRSDFDRPDTDWIVVVFSSAACTGCGPVIGKAAVLASPSVAVVDCEYQAQRDLHERYGIEGVPTTVVADRDGVVRAGFIGAVSATDLWASVADLRHPPAIPRVCGEHADPSTVEVPH